MPGLIDLLNRGKESYNIASASQFPLGRGGVQGLRDILQNYFLPELARARAKRGPIEDAYLEQSLTPGSLYGAASTAAMGRANELFKPGGEIASMIGRARGQTINAGFNPENAYGAENSILRAGSQAIGDTFAQNAAGLEAKRADMLTGAYGQNDVRDLIESLFTGVGSAEQLNLAKNPPRQKFLGIF